MFGRMNVIAVLDLRNAPAEIANCSEGAVARLLDVTDHPKIENGCSSRRPCSCFFLSRATPNLAPSTYTTAAHGCGTGSISTTRSSADTRSVISTD